MWRWFVLPRSHSGWSLVHWITFEMSRSWTKSTPHPNHSLAPANYYMKKYYKDSLMIVFHSFSIRLVIYLVDMVGWVILLGAWKTRNFVISRWTRRNKERWHFQYELSIYNLYNLEWEFWTRHVNTIQTGTKLRSASSWQRTQKWHKAITLK